MDMKDFFEQYEKTLAIPEGDKGDKKDDKKAPEAGSPVSGADVRPVPEYVPGPGLTDKALAES